MKITVLFNRVISLDVGRPKDILADDDTVKTAQAIATALQAELFELTEKTAKDLKNIRTDVFFNTAFGIGNSPKSEAEVTVLLEKTGIPYTGSDAKAITLTTNKYATKKILQAFGLPVPGETNFPLIVKPSNEDCSLGISQMSIVRNKSDLEKQIKLLQKTYSEDVLVEEYINGRELNVTVLKDRVLPISEIVFGKSFKNKYKIVDFAAKWEENTSDYKETVGVCPAKLLLSVQKKIEGIALHAFNVTGCKDYARVDMRLANNSFPYILEVNANPGVGPEDGATRSAKAAGLSYREFLEKIIDATLIRFENQRNGKS